MISVSGKYWEEILVNKRLVEKFKIENNLTDTVSKIVVDRNFTSKEIYSLDNDVEFSNPFFNNKDFIIATEILKKNIEDRNNILVIGDYDVDGCVSTSLIINFLNKFNIDKSYYIPDRVKDGYGANINLVKKLIKINNPKLIIMVDCGSSSNDTIEFLNKNQINSIIIDHHNIEYPYPKTNVLINPKKNCSYNKYDYFCSTFLTYLFLDLYIKKNDLKIKLEDQLIYVALATIADVMPLRNHNRFILQKVVKKFDINKNIFLKTLFKLNSSNKKLEYDDLAYTVAPLINSAGRIDNPNKIIQLLTSNSEIQIKKLTKELFQLNQKRKKIENIVLNKIKFKELTKKKGVIFYYDSSIHEGLIGIIASKLKDFFNKPVVVLTKSKNLIKGSARSIPSFNIGQYIYKALHNKILFTGGGHNLAAGLSLQKDKINIFNKYLDEIYLKKQLSNSNKYLSKISFSSVNNSYLKELNKLAPFGNQNEKVIFLIENVKILKPSIIKEKFVSCFIKSKMNKMIKAVSFNPIESSISLNLLNQKKEINILAKINQNNWNNKSNIQLEIVDVISNNT